MTASDFEAAVREFNRVSKPVLVASKVNVNWWLTSGINEGTRNVFVEARFEDEVLTSTTIGDLWIVKCQGQPHMRAAVGISYQLNQYCDPFGRLLVVGGGNMVLSRGIRRADSTVSLRSKFLAASNDLPQVLVEIEFSNRTVDAYEFILGYFALIPCLQAVVFFAFYPHRVDGSYAALAVLYRRGAGGLGVVIDDAVSFGSANISRSASANYPAALKAFGVRELPLAPKGDDIWNGNPWTAADKAFIRVPGEDFFSSQAPAVLVAGAPIPTPACDIDLWRLLKDLSGCTWK